MIRSTAKPFFGENAGEDVAKNDKEHLFCLASAPYRRTRLLSWLLLGGFLLCALISTVLSRQLWSTYAHTFVPYLRWQDALVVSLWYVAFIALAGSVIVVRFLFALHAGRHKGMVILAGDAEIGVRDLSPKNLASIFWAVATAFICFVVGAVGLVPEMLLGWSLHLSHPVLMVLGTTVVILLGIAGLVLTVVTATVVVMGMVGCVSFCKRMGAPQCYSLTGQANLKIDGLILTLIYPGKPESIIDLSSLDEKDQRHLLSLLCRY
jgi:hypothetical protein